MKKCPNCQKTFDDNMKFCQVDGTPLVVVADNEPKADPYATMVANKSDLQIPPEEPKVEEPTPEPIEEPDPYATMVSSSSTPLPEVEPTEEDDDDDILDLGDNEEIDPMKTMVISGNTSDNIKINIPDEESEDEPQDTSFSENQSELDEELASEAKTVISPEIPKFNEPELASPSMSDSPMPKQEEPKQMPLDPPIEPELPKEESKPKPEMPKESKPTPIPSPFDNSMPPGYAPPSTPPFEPPKDAYKPEPLNEIKEDETPKSPFSDPQTPVVESNAEGWDLPSAPMANMENQQIQPIEQSNQFDSPIQSDIQSDTTDQNQTMAYVAMGSGIASMTVCCFIGVLLGPVGLIIGFKARGNAKNNPSEYGGETLALIGMITGAIGTLVGIAWVVYVILTNLIFG